MTDEERNSITNALWLCCNCHKIIDSDPHRFPPGILFDWRERHETILREKLGRTSTLFGNSPDDELEFISSISARARRIVLDKPEYWEYLLTVEQLRSKLDPTISRWRALERGLYTKPVQRFSNEAAFETLQDRLMEMGNFIPTLCTIMNIEFARAWGPPGEPGKPQDILIACDLFAEACEQILAWEETVRFTIVPPAFKELHDLLIGFGGRVLDQVERIPKELSKIFAEDAPSGIHKLEIIIDVPPGWEKRCTKALERLAQSLGVGT